jgi:hypothetical protein
MAPNRIIPIQSIVHHSLQHAQNLNLPPLATTFDPFIAILVLQSRISMLFKSQNLR